jgi:glycosyltransferase involved in cell wall biosynthesis
VILPVRNGDGDLPKAIETILAQTFANFELIVVDNGSTDGTSAYLKTIEDPRLRVFYHAEPGLAGSLNYGIARAQGRYIARQDHDDWALPTRLERQVSFLDAHPDHALVGTRAEIWTEDTPTHRFHDHPIDNAALRFELLFNNPFVHSSVMLRKSVLDEIGLYTTDPARQPPEDYELWSRIARRYQVANLPERLTIYREVPNSISRVGDDPFRQKLVLISSENLAYASGETRPRQIHTDVAALIQGAYARVSPSPDIDRMLTVIDQAGRRVGGDQPGPELLQKIADAQALVRHGLLLRHRPLRLIFGAARIVRGYVRRLMQAGS